MAGAFQAGAFQSNAFQVAVAVPAGGNGAARRFQRNRLPEPKGRYLKEVRSLGAEITIALAVDSSGGKVLHEFATVVSAGAQITFANLVRIGRAQVIHIDEEEELLALGLLPGDLE